MPAIIRLKENKYLRKNFVKRHYHPIHQILYVLQSKKIDNNLNEKMN